MPASFVRDPAPTPAAAPVGEMLRDALAVSATVRVGGGEEPPMLREARLAHARNALEQFRDFQAYAVLRYHPAFSEDPELSQLSIVELRREYNLSALYDELGRG
jgi:hypothetical protein